MKKKQTKNKKRIIKPNTSENVIRKTMVEIPKQEETKQPIQEKPRFKDFIPLNIGSSDDIGNTARVLVEKGEDERLKTEITAPTEMMIAKTIENYLEDKKLPKSAHVINTIVEQFCSFMFSYKRHSRLEYIEAIKASALKLLAEQQQESLATRLTTQEVKK